MKKKQIFIILGIVLVLSILVSGQITGQSITGGIILSQEKPIVQRDANNFPIINEEHINYIMYVVDVETLHKVPFTSNVPEIEALTVTQGKYFTSYAVDGEIQTYTGQALNADLQLKADETTIAKIIESDDPKVAIQDYLDRGWIGIDVYSSNLELFLKGYWGIYENFEPSE